MAIRTTRLKLLFALPISTLLLTILLLKSPPPTSKHRHHIHPHATSGTSHLQTTHISTAAAAKHCSGTPFPDLCHSTLTSFPQLTTKTPLPNIIATTINHTAGAVESSASRCATLLRSRVASYDARQRVALTDCLDLFDQTMSDFNRAVSDLKKHPTSRTDDLRTVLSAAMTNQYSCLDGFAFVNSSNNVRPLIEARLFNISHLVSNSLALAKKIPTDKHNRSSDEVFAEYGKIVDGFPKWVSESDRQLLRDNKTVADLVVAKDGSGNFTTIMAAVNATADHSKTRIVIYIKAGAYFENVEVVKKKTNLMFVGDGIGQTVIKASRNVIDGWTTYRSATVGLKVSYTKSKSFFSKNLSARKKRRFSRALDISQTNDLGRYLGVPLYKGRVTRDTYREVINKLDSKLTAWKGKTLSLAGRVTLAKSVLQALPTFLMQTTSLPVSTCEEIDRKVRNFVWGDTTQKKKIHNHAWSAICKPKEKGGLGLRRVHDMNRAFLLKFGWRLATSMDKLWAKVLIGKYCSGSRPIRRSFETRCSPLWKGLGSVWSLLKTSIGWKIGNGSKVNFWTDNWIINVGPLLPLATSNIPQALLDKKVGFFVTEEGEWNQDLLRGLLLEDVCLRLAATPPARAHDEEDKPSWIVSTSGEFTMESAYNCITNTFVVSNGRHGVWKKIWKWQGPQRVRAFLWLATHGKLTTSKLCHARGMQIDRLCPRCEKQDETVLHALRDCEKARGIWIKLLDRRYHGSFFSMSLVEWVSNNLAGLNCGMRGGVCWSIQFGTAAWQIWKARNAQVFDRELQDDHVMSTRIMSMAEEFAEVMLASPTGSADDRPGNMSWTPPTDNSFKINVDGAVATSKHRDAAAGGVMRDSAGEWRGGFGAFLGRCEPLQAELWAIYYGIRFANQLGVGRCLIETDCSETIRLVCSDASKQCGSTLIQRIKSLLRENHQIALVAVLREANRCADGIAKFSFGLPLGFHILNGCPDTVTQFLYEERGENPPPTDAT